MIFKFSLVIIVPRKPVLDFGILQIGCGQFFQLAELQRSIGLQLQRKIRSVNFKKYESVENVFLNWPNFDDD